MNYDRYDIKIFFRTVPESEWEGEVTPQHTIYSARMTHGPFGNPLSFKHLSMFKEKRFESPVMLEWDDPAGEPVRLMSDEEALARLFECMAKSVRHQEESNISS